MEHDKTISIRPGVSILSILKHIEYDPWYALAEFVDNAIDSFLKFEHDLKSFEGSSFQLEVKIEFNEIDRKITIRDNAAGIHQADYARAFRAAEVPPNNTGLSEFGMGMKSAACWFSDRWSVRSSALGEDVEKIVTFDLEKIFFDKVEELQVEISPKAPAAHFTCVELLEISKMPIKKTKGKIRDHLASIYRDFTRKGILKLFVDNELMVFDDPIILNAPFPYDSKTDPIFWRKDIDFEVEKDKLYVKGFVALRETMSNNESGFALFRRGRVIEGSSDQGFRPKEIMGDSGSPEHKRIFGELHLEGFDVSFTKKGIKWDENMDIFLDLLRSDLNQPSFPLLKQARDYRVKPTKAEMIKTAESVVKTAVENIETRIQPTVSEIRASPPASSEDTELSDSIEISHREFELDLNDTKWIISVELSFEEGIYDWLDISSSSIQDPTSGSNCRKLNIRMSLNHPFVAHFAGTDKSKLEPILRLAAVIGLAEEAARESGVSKAGTIRRNINKLLTAVSK